MHREAALIAARLGEPVPCYRTVHRVIRGLEPALVTLAHEGAKAYGDAFDLVHRTRGKGAQRHLAGRSHRARYLRHGWLDKPRKPWLTVILDDYSRAVAGFLLFFGAPSAIQTALAFRQAIWRKVQPGWHVCGIPQVLYTDHGADFTSQHLEQVAADLKIRLSFSTVAKPRGRGKIERFFESLSQVCLSRLPGYGRPASAEAAVLTLSQLTQELEHYLIDEYLVTPHSATDEAPQARWEAGGFLPADAGLAGAARSAPAHRAQNAAGHPGRHSFPGDALRRHRRSPPTSARTSSSATTPATWPRSGSSMRTVSFAGRSARSWREQPSPSGRSPPARNRRRRELRQDPG